VSLLGWLVIGAGAWALLRGLRLAWRVRRLGLLPAVDLPADEDLPTLSVIAAGRDEAAAIEGAVRSWLALDLPGLEVIVVDDRSRDESPAILARLAKEDPRLIHLRIDERPEGWLGKCHALRIAAERASGDFLLFTDADVEFQPEGVRKSLALVQRDQLDLLTLLPMVRTEGWLQASFTFLFFQVFLEALGSRRVNRGLGGGSLGVGAFGMVRRACYEAAGGHEQLRMQVGDDTGLTRVILRQGGKQRVHFGFEVASLQWQSGVLGTVRGLEKNAYWGLRLSPVLLVAATLMLLWQLLPLAGPAFGPWGLASFGCYWVGAFLGYQSPETSLGKSLVGTLLHPLSWLLLITTLWNSAIATWRRGGIDWRGDFFSTGELRAELKPLSWWMGKTPASETSPGQVRSSSSPTDPIESSDELSS
jgi:hypothetical protein